MANVRTQTAYVSSNVLQWARERAGLTVEALAGKAHLKAEKIFAWEQGNQSPTMRQAEHLAGTLHVPFGYFFLQTPPEDNIPIADFRIGPDNERGKASPDLLDVINDVIVKQQWYREFLLEENNRPLNFVGKFKISDDPDTIADDIRKTLGVQPSVREESTTWKDFLRTLIKMTENNGILVMKSGIVGSNPHRKLRVGEFRGFTIADDLAPVIFINGTDTKAAQIFTLAHELAHVWINASGVSDERMDNLTTVAETSEGSVESLCDQTAAEFLVPQKEFTWNETTPATSNVVSMARHYKVSRLVILRRALDLGFIDKDTFFDQYKIIEADYAKQEQDQREEGGGNFFPTLFSRNSATFTRAVLESVGQEKTLYREAAQLLNVKVPTVNKVMEYLQLRAQ